MSFEAVNIRVTDDTAMMSPLAGVVVKVLSQDGKLVFGQITTDGSGLATLLLPAPAIYQVRFYKFGVSFSGAQLIAVLSAPSTNNFSVKGTVYTYPQSLDPRLCIASGFFRTPSGAVAASIDMHFIGRFDPLLLDGAAILPERVIARTDNQGYVSVSLVRFAMYDVTLQGMEDYSRLATVPDAPAVNIGDLLFPVVTLVNFEETGPYTVRVGQDLVLHPHVFTSDLRELPDITSDLLWSTSDSSGLGINPTSSSVGVHGITPGTYTLMAPRRDQSIIRIPNTPVGGVPLTIVVTP